MAVSMTAAFIMGFCCGFTTFVLVMKKRLGNDDDDTDDTPKPA